MHMVNSNQHGIPSDKARERDDAAGMIWWNALDKAQRKHWMEVAGNTGRAVDAWMAFRSQASVKGEADQ